MINDFLTLSAYFCVNFEEFAAAKDYFLKSCSSVKFHQR